VVVTYRERLEAAVTEAHHRCIECGNDHVTVEHRPALGDWIPVSHHWAKSADDCCPVLHGGLAAAREHDDLWNDLDATGLIVVGDYGEETWTRRELVRAVGA
jgi:hypothetical protein